ncbi:MAG: DNA polymerase III subunit alpha [Flavobacteriales bacterium]
MLLNCHSWFSLRYGTMSPEQLVMLLAHQGHQAAALTDINNTSACWNFIKYGQEKGIHPVIGVDFRRGEQQCFVALARNMQGLFCINQLLSAHLCHNTTLPDEAPEIEDAFIIYPLENVPRRKLRHNEYVGVRPHEVNRQLPTSLQTKAVALCTYTFPNNRHLNLHRLLRCIDQNTLLSKLNKAANTHEKAMSPSAIRDAYRHHPEWLDRATQLLLQCHLNIEFGQSRNKQQFTNSKAQDRQLLEKLAFDGLHYRYGKRNKEAEKRVKHELEIIFKLGFTSYFLITEDVVRYARHRDFFHVGRGSGANSIVAYCLRITDVDPIELDLYFERFINPHRTSPPDFDLDFSWKDRDEILQYMFERYGMEHTALVGAYNTFQKRAAVRELGKVFGLPKAEIDALDGRILSSEDPIHQAIERYGSMMQDMPNHLGIHAGGVVISEAPIHCYSATFVPPKGFPVTCFDMYVAEDIGLYKFDILSQRGLGHIREAVQLVRENQKIQLDIHRVDEFKQDPAVQALIRDGKAMGCFYVESPAMRMLLSKLRCQDYITLVAASSIIRPGVARSGMMREYIRRFHHPDSFTYIHPKMEDILRETYGVMVYQEDVIRVAHQFAGLDPAEADILRRGMSGKFRSRQEFQRVADTFVENCRTRGYPDEITHEVWRQIESFSGYSFSKAHSASFAVESFQSLYLKAHFPLEFMTAVLNNFGGFYKTEDYVHEARMLGADVQAPCINHSRMLCCIRGKTIFLGFTLLHQLEQKLAEYIEQEREQNGLYLGLADFFSRVPCSLEQAIILIRIGAFRFTGKPKKALLWEAHSLMRKTDQKPIGNLIFRVEEPSYTLPDLAHSAIEDAYDELELLGFPLCSPFSLIEQVNVPLITARQMRDYHRKKVHMLGYVMAVKDTRTIKGDRMNFATFYDCEGYMFDSTHFPQVLQRYPFRGRGVYLIEGLIAEEFGFFSLEVIRMEKIPYRNRGY